MAHALLFYANRGPYGFSQEELDEARDHLRGLAGQLRASLFHVPLYDTLARLRFVPPREAVLAAATELVGWSNGLNSERSDTLLRRQAIAEKLDIHRLMDVG